MNDKEILKGAVSVTENYDKVYQTETDYFVKGKGDIKEVKKQLTQYSTKITDQVVKIKINEAKNMIKPLCKKSSVHDDNVSNLLNYYELVNELKSIHG